MLIILTNGIDAREKSFKIDPSGSCHEGFQKLDALRRISCVCAMEGLWESFCAIFCGFRTRLHLKMSSAWWWQCGSTMPKGWGAPTTSVSPVQALLLSLSAKDVLEIFPLRLYFHLGGSIEQNLWRCLWWGAWEEKGQAPQNSTSGNLFAWSKPRLGGNHQPLERSDGEPGGLFAFYLLENKRIPNCLCWECKILSYETFFLWGASVWY